MRLLQKILSKIMPAAMQPTLASLPTSPPPAASPSGVPQPNPPAAESAAPPPPNPVANKRVFFSGKFDWDHETRLPALAVAKRAQIAGELDPSVDFLVVPDLTKARTAQKKAAVLNTKGASIQILDGSTFEAMCPFTPADLLALMRGGKENANHLGALATYSDSHAPPRITLKNQNFDGLDLREYSFRGLGFENCSFRKTILDRCDFNTARGCDFSGACGESMCMRHIEGSRFSGAKFKKVSIWGGIRGADFTEATLDLGEFAGPLSDQFRGDEKDAANCVFRRCSLRGAQFGYMSLKAPIFDQADLFGAVIHHSRLVQPSFIGARLERASLINSELPNADFNNANCRSANFAGANMIGSRFDGADLAECPLSGTTLDGVDLSKAKNHQPQAIPPGVIGPALRELDQLAGEHRSLRIQFLTRPPVEDEYDRMIIHVHQDAVSNQSYCESDHFRQAPQRRGPLEAGVVSAQLLKLSDVYSNHTILFETVFIEAVKTKNTAKELRTLEELRQLVRVAISEAFAQPLPPPEKLAADSAAYLASLGPEGPGDDYDRRRKLLKEQEARQLNEAVQQEVGRVTDLSGLLKALPLRAGKPKLDKAMSMLKESTFQLFSDVADTHLNGIVKSQSDPDLVYACRVDSSGGFACCTQNLKPCGGLKGSACKHLLVLIIGLVKTGKLDAAAIDAWLAKSALMQPKLDKEIMAEIFTRYKGAEAGEVDWRPTETVPEDYYAL